MTSTPEIDSRNGTERAFCPGPPRCGSASSRARRGLAGGLAMGAALLAMSACSGKQAPPTDSSDSEPEGPWVSGVNATVIVSKCPDAGRMKVRTAQDAIQRLVGPCASVPGGSAHFSATLNPGGRIILASPEGDPAEGVVPTCVLQNRLYHRVFLKSPCTLDVQLDERKVPVERDAGAPDAEPAPAK